MTALVAAALVLAPAVGVLAGRMHDAEAYERARRAHDQALIQARAQARGWRRIEVAAHASTTWELLVATREFALPLANGVVTGRTPRGEALGVAVRVVEGELGRYPDGVLGAARLQRVVLVAELQEAGAPIPSLPNIEHTLLLDVGSAGPFLRRLVHHEMFHFLDFADDQELRLDPGWISLNPVGFRYAGGGRAVRDPGSAALVDDLPGFITPYAQAAVEEDKAELFSFLMTAPDRVQVLAEADLRLRAKVGALLDRLKAAHPLLASDLERLVLGG